MTTFKSEPSAGVRPADDKIPLAKIVETVTGGAMPLRFTAYDNSAAGPENSPYALHLASPKGATYIATAPGDLGMARAYTTGDLVLEGRPPGTIFRSHD